MRKIEPLAVELNEVIRREAPFLYQALSALGRELYFPRGILTQTAEARESAHLYNATIGIAMLSGEPMYLPSLFGHLKGLTPAEVFDYAPAGGLAELRRQWSRHQEEMNPGLKGKSRSLPVVTSGLTHGLSICADLFCDAGDLLLLPDKNWGNYRMIFGTRRGAHIAYYPLFHPQGRLDVDGIRDSLLSASTRPKVLLLLNFPQNPTGYTPDQREALGIRDAVVEAAEAGTNVIVCVDDAYFGLVYEEEAFGESLFSLLADCHPRVTAVKIDGPTKEDFSWGLRVGFITFSHREDGDTEAVYRALEKKVCGLIRGTVSNSPMLSQSLLLKAMGSEGYRREKEELFRILRERYREVKRVLSKPAYGDMFRPYPFNSGYFLCLKLFGVDAESLRRRLLESHGVGVISTGDNDLRIAYSCLEKEHVEDLFDILYSTARELSTAR